MPLKPGSSTRVISHNIRELMHGYERTGMIGSARPDSKGAAIKQAAAIAYAKAGR